jgi:hypothetical protein
VVYQHYGFDKISVPLKYSNISIRQLMEKYSYTEQDFEHLVFQSFDYNDSRNEVPDFPWWEKKEVHNRVS